MKLYLIIVLLSAFVSLSLGQTLPSASPEKIKTFGSSLEKYRNKNQKNKKQQPDSQENRKVEESNDGEVIRVKSDLVVNDVLVTDQNRNVITGLKKDDFIVTENSVPQTIEIFSPGENASVPRSIVLVIDCVAPQVPYIRKSIEAAKLLVDKLNPNDKMAIVTVDVKLRMDFTTDKTLLKKTLDSLETKDIKIWGGLEFDALLAVLNEMFAAEDRRPIIIFQGDGTEIIWLQTDKDAPYRVSNSVRENSGMRYTGKMRNFGFSEVKEAVASSRATIYSIIPGIRFLGFSKEERLARAKTSFKNTYRALGIQEKYLPVLMRKYQGRDAEVLAAGQTAMFRVAELSGGNAGFIEKPEDAESIYSDIFTVIKNRYVIGYYPTNEARDGKRRNVKIDVRNHPEYIVTGRKAYFAPETGE